jgi:hypothetical protein
MGGMTRPSRPPALRQTCFDDYEQIANLERRHGLTAKSREDWTHLWSGNPVFQLHPDWPLGWVLENDDKQIVGSLGNIPLHYEFQGSTILTAAGRSWVTDPAYRTYAPLLMDQYFHQKDADLLLNTTVNSQAAQAFSLFGSSPVPAGKWDSASFWITRRRAFSEKILAARRVPFATFCSYPAAAGLSLREKLLQRNRIPVRPGIVRPGIRIEQCAGFDDRFEAFWQQLRESRPGILLGNRSRATLEWHFRDKATILTYTEGSELAAYAILQRKDHTPLGLIRARLIDFQALRQSEVLANILSEALSECMRRNIHVLEHIGSGVRSRQLIDETAPYRRKLPAWAFFYKARDKSLHRALENPAAWDPSSFDGDASL